MLNNQYFTFSNQNFDKKLIIWTNFDLLKPKSRQAVNFLTNFDQKNKIFTHFDIKRPKCCKKVDFFDKFWSYNSQIVDKNWLFWLTVNFETNFILFKQKLWLILIFKAKMLTKSWFFRLILNYKSQILDKQLTFWQILTKFFIKKPKCWQKVDFFDKFWS